MIASLLTKQFGVTNFSTHGFAWQTNDREAAERCARTIGGWVVEREAVR